MTTIRISFKLKIPDGMTDEEINKLFIEYLNIKPVKQAKLVKCPDGLGWLI